MKVELYPPKSTNSAYKFAELGTNNDTPNDALVDDLWSFNIGRKVVGNMVIYIRLPSLDPVDITFKLAIMEGTPAEFESNLPTFDIPNFNLIESKANFISIGRNLLDANALAESRTALELDTSLTNPYTIYTAAITDSREWSFQNAEIKLTLPAGTYTILGQYNQLVTNQLLRVFNTQDTILASLIGSADYGTTNIQNATFTLDTQQTIGIMCKLLGSTVSLALYYGTDKTDFEPYTQDYYQCNLSLGGFDYIDVPNGKRYVATSDVLTLDGSGDEV